MYSKSGGICKTLYGWDLKEKSSGFSSFCAKNHRKKSGGTFLGSSKKKLNDASVLQEYRLRLVEHCHL